MQKKSYSLAFFSLFEILIGFLGSMLFFTSLDWSSMRSFYFIPTQINDVYALGINTKMLNMGIFYCFMTFPFVLMLFSGGGMLLHKAWARKVTVFFIPSLTIAILTLAFMLNRYTIRKDINWISFFGVAIALVSFSIISIWFLNRPKIKTEFKPKTNG